MFYLQAKTRNEIGGERRRQATDAILKEINAALGRAIPDDRERARWIKGVKETVPPRKEEETKPTNK